MRQSPHLLPHNIHPPILSQPPLPNPWAWLVLVLWSNQFASGQGFFSDDSLMSKVQTPCYQKLRHSIYPDFHLIFCLCLACRAWYVIWTDPCWWYFHHSDVVVGCLSKVSRGASGACVRPIPCMGSWSPSLPHRVSCHPNKQNLQLSRSHHNKNISISGWRTWKTLLLEGRSTKSNLVPEIHWNNRRLKCSHALKHGCRYVLHKSIKSTYICI